MADHCRHLRPVGRCLRCEWGAGLGSRVIASVTDSRLVSVPSVAGKQCLLHWVAAAADAELNAARAAEGLEPLLVCSGHRRMRWRTRQAYEDYLVRRYRHRLPEGATRAQIIAYGDDYIAFRSIHGTGLARDYDTCGLEPVSATADEQRQSEGYLWLMEYAKRPELEGRLVNYRREPWHWEWFVDEDVWASLGPEVG